MLSNSTYTLLEKGLSFVPKPPVHNICDIISDRNRLIRDVKIKSINHNEEKQTKQGDVTNRKGGEKIKKFIEINKNWEPGDWRLDAESTRTIDRLLLTSSECINEEFKKNELDSSSNSLVKHFDKAIKNCDKNNLTRQERESLKELKQNKNIIIKPADKGGATVVMDVEVYVKEVERQLNNSKYYTEITESLAPQNVREIKKILDKIYSKKLISAAQLKYLSGPSDYSERQFYILPKIHKPKDKWPQPNMPEGRPIVSDTNSESQRVAEYIDYHINHISTKNFSYIKNSYDFVEQVRSLPIRPGALLVTGDVKSLYTNMNLDRTIEEVKQALLRNPAEGRPDAEIIELLEYTLKHNDFKFNNKQFLQTCGVAMGKRYAPSLANIYLSKFDEWATTGYELRPELWKRFLDDVFFIWNHGLPELKKFETYLNSLIPGIEITLEYSSVEIPFLDVLLYVRDGLLCTKTFFKSTDTHQLLHTDSYHPTHTTAGILKSQFIRFKKLSSNLQDYNDTCAVLYKFLKTRGYTSSKFRKLKYQIWHEYIAVEQQNKDSGKILPIVVQYSSVGTKLARCYKNVLQQDSLLKKYRIMAAYKIAPNLKKILVRTAFGEKRPTASKNKFVKCTSVGCKMCIENSREIDNVRSRYGNKTFRINQRLNCNSTNVIYLINCKKCGIQYIGETSRSLKQRFNDHASNIATKKQTAIAIHFNEDGHSKKDLEISAIEKIENNNAQDRKQREKYWIQRLNTTFPHGLNNYPIPQHK